MLEVFAMTFRIANDISESAMSRFQSIDGIAGTLLK
jgi:hypothetical protein